MKIEPRTIIDLILISLLIFFTNQVHESNSQIDSLSPLNAPIINSKAMDNL